MDFGSFSLESKGCKKAVLILLHNLQEIHCEDAIFRLKLHAWVKIVSQSTKWKEILNSFVKTDDLR